MLYYKYIFLHSSASPVSRKSVSGSGGSDSE